MKQQKVKKMKLLKVFFSAAVIVITLNSYQNVLASESISDNVKISGYLETYYTYDFGNPADHNRPSFNYSYNRHNEMNLNIGYIKAGYETENTRANLALMTGTYANANMSAEEGVMKNIYEANIGFRLSDSANIWIDAGVFSSHIGFESARGADCWTLTRSILADNSPYFETGAKITYITADNEWLFSALVLNGWQRIRRVDGNNTPAFGHQITYKPNDNLTLNSSSFIGNDMPDSTSKMRYFHDFFGQIQVTESLGMIFGFDCGAQQSKIGSDEYDIWYSPILVAKYSLSDKVDIATRLEYYSDENQVIIATGTPSGFQTFGYSLNLDYNIQQNVKLRFEGRNLNSKDKIFAMNNEPSNLNYFFTTSLSMSF